MNDSKPRKLHLKTCVPLLLFLLQITPIARLTGQSTQTIEGELREWTFKNGNVSELRFKNAYGKTVYFADKNGGTTFSNILALVPEDQAEVVYWSRIRDKEIFENTSESTKFEEQFQKDAFRLDGKKLIKNEWQKSGLDPEFYAIYTSASWCKPCRGFTPSLVTFYKTTRNFYQGQYEMVLCSWDQSQTEMIEYMLEDGMPWYGNWKSRKSTFWRKYQGNGIPCLVIVDRNGFILSHSYDSTGYLGPSSSLDNFRGILMHAYGNKDERLSVPTPGIDLSKLNQEFKKRKKAAKDNQKKQAPALAFSPRELLKNLEDAEAESLDLKAKLEISKRGVVTQMKLTNVSNPSLEREIAKALMLWQFVPAITAEGEEKATVLTLPLSLRVKKEYRNEELSQLD